MARPNLLNVACNPQRAIELKSNRKSLGPKFSDSESSVRVDGPETKELLVGSQGPLPGKTSPQQNMRLEAWPVSIHRSTMLDCWPCVRLVPCSLEDVGSSQRRQPLGLVNIEIFWPCPTVAVDYNRPSHNVASGKDDNKTLHVVFVVNGYRPHCGQLVLSLSWCIMREARTDGHVLEYIYQATIWQKFHSCSLCGKNDMQACPFGAIPSSKICI